MVIPEEEGAPPVLTIGAWQHATFYTYDIHGNVNELLHDYRTGGMSAANQYKKFKYEYSLISGKLNKLLYQPDQPDAFYHAYEYDLENNLQSVSTSREGIIWDIDARYHYYRHGSLARMVLGENQVQGVDYSYTSQGWLKGVNSTAVGDGSTDMGADGASTGPNRNVGRDAYGFSINYYVNDYKAISGLGPFASIIAPLGSNGGSLYNGNIAAMAVNIPKLGGGIVYSYGYDQLNRLASMRAYGGLSGANVFQPIDLQGSYSEDIRYDANGNILTYVRNGHGNQKKMDELDYHYYYESTQTNPAGDRVWKTYSPGTTGNVQPADLYAFTNRLAHVRDNPLYTANYVTEDLDDQPEGNYKYDEIGNLVKDQSQNIEEIEWTVFGKVSKVRKTNGLEIAYTYDAAGHRISKSVGGNETWYVRDATGNVISVYFKPSGQPVRQTELHVHGKNRLGVLFLDALSEPQSIIVNGAEQNTGFKRRIDRGAKQYELGNHLDNVLVTVTDKAVQVQDPGSTDLYYVADVGSAVDYSPYGMQLVGRVFQAPNYRYGYNGKEKDDEVSSDGNFIDFGSRVYDPRLGRFLSLDPLAMHFPSMSNYSYSFNNPVFFIDEEGESPISMFAKQAAKVGIKKAAKEFIEQQIKSRMKAYVSKGWAKQLMKDAEDALDILDTEWWEYIVEVIPVAGDIYGAASLGSKGYKLWKKLEEIKDKAARAIHAEERAAHLLRRTQKVRDALANTNKRLSASLKNAAQWTAKGFQAHHVIPVGVLEKNEWVQEAVLAGWDFNNGDLNGKWLPKGFHVNHPGYNEFVTMEIDGFVQGFRKSHGGRDPSGLDIANFLNKDLAPKLRKRIEEAQDIWLKGGKKKEDNIARFFRNLVNKKK